MCRSSLYSVPQRRNVTRSLPSGNIFAPLTALGITLEGRRVVTCAFRVGRIAFPAAEMSAPESGRALELQEPLVAMIYLDLLLGLGQKKLRAGCCLVQGYLYHH